MRHGCGAVLAHSYLTDDRTLGDRAPAGNVDRAELEQRDRVSVGGLDRERAAARRDRPDEGHGARDGRANRLVDRRADIDAAVLPGLVLVCCERERPQDRPLHRPGPAGSGRDEDQSRGRCRDRDGEHAPHELPPS